MRLAVLAGSALLVVLFFAALDLLVPAAWAAVVAAALLVLAGITALYRALPEDGRELVLSRRAVRSSATAALLLGVIVSCGFWYSSWVPFDSMPAGVQKLMLAVWPPLDLIPSTFSLALPGGWRSGFHQYFNDVTYCFPGPFWWESMRYLRAAIPAYAVTFFATLLLARLLWATGRRVARGRASR